LVKHNITRKKKKLMTETSVSAPVLFLLIGLYITSSVSKTQHYKKEKEIEEGNLYVSSSAVTSYWALHKLFF
jgi:hypothetical protein